MYLVSYNVVFSNVAYYTYTYMVYNGNTNYWYGPSCAYSYQTPDGWTVNMDANYYLPAGTTLDFMLFATNYGSEPYVTSESSYSGIALPQGMPIISFQASLQSAFYTPGYNSPTRITNWYTTFQSSYGGSHDLNANFDVSSGYFHAPMTGVYYCYFSGVAYNLQSTGNLEVELRINDVRNTSSINYGRMAYNNEDSYINSYHHAAFTYLAEDQTLSVYTTCDNCDYFYWQYYGMTGRGGPATFGCTLVGTTDS